MVSHIPVPVPAPPHTGSGQTGREKLEEEKRGASQGRRLMEDLPERLSPPKVRKCKDMSRAGQSFDYKTGISKYMVIWLGSLETHRFGESKGQKGREKRLWHLAVKGEANGEISRLCKMKEQNQRTHSSFPTLQTNPWKHLDSADEAEERSVNLEENAQRHKNEQGKINRVIWSHCKISKNEFHCISTKGNLHTSLN